MEEERKGRREWKGRSSSERRKSEGRRVKSKDEKRRNRPTAQLLPPAAGLLSRMTLLKMNLFLKVLCMDTG